jgi:hypothetical protein
MAKLLIFPARESVGIWLTGPPPWDFTVLTGHEWRTIILGLTLHAARKLKRLRLKNGVLPLGYGGPEDVAGEALKLVLTGQRSWTPEVGVPLGESLLEGLRSVVDSIVSHLIESADYVRRSEMKETPSDAEQDILNRICFEQWVRIFRDCAQGEPQLCAVINLLEQGLKPREIAKSLRVPNKQVYQWIRTLKRRAKSAGLLSWLGENADD